MTQFPIAMRFRPECLHDVEVLQKSLPDMPIVVPPSPEDEDGKLHHGMGAALVDVAVSSQDELKLLVSTMAAQEDGHRMWQTLDVTEHFTGDAFEGEESGRYARLEALLGLETGYEAHIFNPEGDDLPGPG